MRSAAEVIGEVVIAHRIAPADISGYSHARHLVRARDEAAWRLRTELGWSLPRIGALLRRHHTSVLVAVRRHTARVAA